MRVTESYLIDLAADSVSKSRDRVAEVGNQAASGIKVDRPSEDLAAWAEGMRAEARTAMSTSRGNAIGRATDRLTVADSSLQTVTTALQRATELATQLANATYNASDRKYAAVEVRTMRDGVLAALNATSSDGEHVFGGNLGTTKAPFDAAGNYSGDGAVRTIETGESEQTQTSLPGSFFTPGGGGADVLKTINALADALDANDPVTVTKKIADLNNVTDQVSRARAVIGARMQALQSADDARKGLEDSLAATKSRNVEADPVATASALAKNQTAFELAKAVSQQIMTMLDKL